MFSCSRTVIQKTKHSKSRVWGHPDSSSAKYYVCITSVSFIASIRCSKQRIMNSKIDWYSFNMSPHKASEMKDVFRSHLFFHLSDKLNSDKATFKQSDSALFQMCTVDPLHHRFPGCLIVCVQSAMRHRLLDANQISHLNLIYTSMDGMGMNLQLLLNWADFRTWHLRLIIMIIIIFCFGMWHLIQ